MCYFDLADMIGHLGFGIKEKMKIIYEERLKEGDKLLIISDHGIKAIERYGDHGFYSFNFP